MTAHVQADPFRSAVRWATAAQSKPSDGHIMALHGVDISVGPADHFGDPGWERKTDDLALTVACTDRRLLLWGSTFLSAPSEPFTATVEAAALLSAIKTWPRNLDPSTSVRFDLFPGVLRITPSHDDPFDLPLIGPFPNWRTLIGWDPARDTGPDVTINADHLLRLARSAKAASGSRGVDLRVRPGVGMDPVWVSVVDPSDRGWQGSGLVMPQRQMRQERAA